MQDLGENCLDQNSINELVEKCFKISKAYLCLNQKKIHKLLYINGLDVDDVAIDSIAGMFVKDEKGKFKFLANSFNSWQPPVETEEDASFFLNKVVAKRVEQHIISLLKEADPFFSKILDSLNYLIKKNGLKKINYLGCIYIVECESGIYERKLIDNADFEKIPMRFLLGKDILQQLFQYLRNSDEFSPAIPLNLLIHRIKELNLSNPQINNHTNDPFAQFEVKEVLRKGLNSVSEKLKDSYLQKGKLCPEDIASINKTFGDISDDLKDGGINRGLYEYLHTHMVNLSPDEYHLKYQNIVEYLMKVMKNTIASSLKSI